MPEEFRQILDTYQNRVYNQAYRMLGNAEDAEETTQDIFLKIYRSLDEFRGESMVSTWIYKITSNECISRLRKKQLDIASFDEPFESESALWPMSSPTIHRMPENVSSPVKPPR